MIILFVEVTLAHYVMRTLTTEFDFIQSSP